jgi:succinyl-CoA synthetase beta subunit
MRKILTASKKRGWVMEPQAKRLFSLAGVDVPRFTWARSEDEAVRFAQEIGYPVVCKVVSPEVLHKSDRDGVVVGIDDNKRLTETFARLSQIEGFDGVVVEEMVAGVELIVGAKVDYQFGPVILLGMGGTGVEIYRDVSLRMAPLTQKDIASMMSGLKAHRILEGYRGAEPVDLRALARLLEVFSDLIMDLHEMIDSVDLNPVICSPSRCTVADARIILRSS